MKHPALTILEELVAICSVNPALDRTARGEGVVADYIEGRCRSAGLKVSRQTVFPGRANLIVELRAGRADTLLLEAHMDTVPVADMPDALTPIYRDGHLYGRGACDTKGSLAAMLFAVEEAAAHPERLSCDLVLCCAVDEEHGARGIRTFMELEMPISGAVVGEPTELQIVIAHKGCARFAVETRGKAAHSSVPHEGDNAIFQMLEVLRFIREHIEPELAAQVHPLCGAPSLVVGTIRGGTQVNIVPAACEIEIDRRLIPGEDAREVMDEFTRRLSEKVRSCGVNFTARELLLDPPLNTPPDAAIVRCAGRAAQSLALKPNLTGVSYGSDASKLQHIGGIPSIVFGPGSIARAHSSQESVPVVEVEQAAQFYGELTRTFKVGD